MMDWQIVSFVFDVVIVAMLGGTAFFAVRLGRHLKNFHESREAMDGLLGELTSQVDRAYKAIEGMRENARQSGRDLQQNINDAKAIADELQIIVGSADNLATRLSMAAEKGKTVMPAVFPQARKMPVNDRDDRSDVLFNIRDPEFDQDDAYDDMDNREPVSSTTEMHSRAERELHDAINRHRKKSGAGSLS